MNFISDLTLDTFLTLLFAVPALAAVVGYFRKLKWLKIAVGLQAIEMVISLAALFVVVETGRCRNCTGMEGLAFLVLPGFFLTSVAVSFSIYGVVRWIARLLHRNRTDIS